jgi:uncharacterized cupredoxin-like copper-binding protein
MSHRRMFGVVPMLASAAVLFVPAASIAQAAVKAHPAAAPVTVAASEYKFVLSTKTLKKPGSVTFKVTNKGHVPHDFAINKKKTALLSPGKSATLTVKFTKKGSYYYDCTVPGHAALGMKGYFKVL